MKLHDLRRACIEEVNEKIRLRRFFERGLERLDETMRQLADEADRVREQQRLVRGERDFARRRAERGEELVLDEHIGASEAAEQRGFSGIRVADDRAIRHGRALAILALRGAGAADVHEFALELIHRLPTAPPILFELALALAASADAAALPAEMAPCAREPRQRIFELREFDLQPRLSRLCA